MEFSENFVLLDKYEDDLLLKELSIFFTEIEAGRYTLGLISFISEV